MNTHKQIIAGSVIATILAALAFVGIVSASPALVNVASAGYGGNNKVEICHKGKKTLSVAAPAVQAHLNHGDTVSACGS